jgi:hypothetical protein
MHASADGGGATGRVSHPERDSASGERFRGINAGCSDGEPQSRTEDRGACRHLHGSVHRRAAGGPIPGEAVCVGSSPKIRFIETCRRTGHRLTELYPSAQDRVRSYFRPIHRPGASGVARDGQAGSGAGGGGEAGADDANAVRARGAGGGADFSCCGSVARALARPASETTREPWGIVPEARRATMRARQVTPCSGCDVQRRGPPDAPLGLVAVHRGGAGSCSVRGGIMLGCGIA